MYSSQLVRGDQYKTLRRCVSVFILAYDELPSGRFHAKFVLREVHDEEVLTDQIELHLVQLRHTPGDATRDDERQLVGWGRFLMADSDEEREAVAMTDPMLAKANEALGELSADPEARRLAADREEAFLLGRFELQEAREEGREEGAEQGQRKLLLKLASLRFGVLPEHVVQRIESANGDELLRWGEALLTDSVGRLVCADRGEALNRASVARSSPGANDQGGEPPPENGGRHLAVNETAGKHGTLRVARIWLYTRHAQLPRPQARRRLQTPVHPARAVNRC